MVIEVRLTNCFLSESNLHFIKMKLVAVWLSFPILLTEIRNIIFFLIVLYLHSTLAKFNLINFVQFYYFLFCIFTESGKE